MLKRPWRAAPDQTQLTKRAWANASGVHALVASVKAAADLMADGRVGKTDKGIFDFRLDLRLEGLQGGLLNQKSKIKNRKLSDSYVDAEKS